MKVTDPRLWAPIRTPKRGKPWIVWSCVRSTRREAKAAYLEGFDPEYHEKILKNIRFAKVTLTEQ